MSTVIPPVPHEPIKIPKKGKGLPDVVMVTAISCKAGGRRETQIGVCRRRNVAMSGLSTQPGH